MTVPPSRRVTHRRPPASLLEEPQSGGRPWITLRRTLVGRPLFRMLKT